MKTISDEISALVGVENDWQEYIRSLVKRRMTQFSANALLDDVITDVTSGLILDLQDGKLDKSLKVAFGKLNDVKGVLAAAVNYRIRGESVKLRKFYKPSAELVEEVAAPAYEPDETEQYKNLLSVELEVMAGEWTNKARVKRLKLAAKVAPARADGGKIDDLMKRFDVKSKATMHEIIGDIEAALKRVAVKVGNETLIYGTQKMAA